MKFIITGGGTGGHIYPALAIAHKIKSEFRNAEILYVGTKNGMESKIVPKEGFNYKEIRVKGFRRKLSLDTLSSMKEVILGLNDARKIIKEFKPNIVIGTGGYVSGPVALIAAINKIPTLIHEQNSYPGVTNRILSRYVDKIAVNFDESKRYFKKPENVILTGNPIRKEFTETNKEKAYDIVNIDKSKKFIMSIGGSGGQKSLNDAMIYFINKNLNNKDIQILHITGNRHYDEFVNTLEKNNIKLLDNIKIVPYYNNMADGLSVADLVITSSGAITISEITAIGVPSIMIPKGYTTENHQEYNARTLEKKGASKVILENELNGEVLYKLVNELLLDESKLREMRNNSKNVGILNSTDRILNIVKDLIK